MASTKKKNPPQLNKFMHTRNPYKKSPPSFKELATLYPEFRAHCTYNITGKVFLDFKNPDALRALTICLLDKDFGLKVFIPPNRLVPTLPLRLNYLLWIEDLLNICNKMNNSEGSPIIGLDIGAGAACIYPLLGIKKFNWKFIATENDDISFEAARNNIVNNNLGESIQLLKEPCMFEVLNSPPAVEFVNKLRCPNLFSETNKDSSCWSKELDFQVDFTVCNPPFFSSDEELNCNHNSKKESRSQPSSVSTGSAHEKVTEGGELNFINKMVEMSVRFKDRIKIFSTLVGKQSDVKKVTRIVKEKAGNTCVKVCDTEFCQGRTMRWGVAWTFFCDDIPLEKVSSVKKKLSQKPLVLNIPRSLVASYSVTTIWKRVNSWLKDVKIKTTIFKENNFFVGASLKAYKPTWQKQRRKRREKERNIRESRISGNQSAPRLSKRSQEEIDQEYAEAQARVSSPKRLKLKSVSSDGGENHGDECDALSSEPSSSPYSKGSDRSISDLSNLTLDRSPFSASTKAVSNHDKNAMDVNDNSEISCSSVIVSPSKNELMSFNRRSLTGSKTNGSLTSSTGIPLDSNSNSDVNSLDSSNKPRRSADEFQVVASPLPVDASLLNSDTSDPRTASTDIPVDDIPSQTYKPCFLRCSLHLKQTESVISLEMNYIDGFGGKEAMNQLLQYMKNRMSQSF